ncbi:MAG TPA: class I SAM-dependent methyltransferase [Chloroflexota bacterium]|nr:class I SAM-dependent methyltransferase [Chloroflexota bacterium]
MASPPSVAELFGRGAREYDAVRRRLVPCLDAFYGAALDAARWAFPDAAARLRILDLGAGTGLLSAAFAQAYRHASFSLVDVSDEMLARARERFGDAAGRFTFRVADYAVEPLPGGTYDLIISGLSIHHVEDVQKRTLFARCAEALTAGGALVNADQVAGATPALTERYLERWRRQAREAGATDQDLADATARMATDRPATLEAQVAWLRDAGFPTVDCPFKDGMFAVLVGYRAA